MAGQWKAFVEAKAALLSARATIRDLKSARTDPTWLLSPFEASKDRMEHEAEAVRIEDKSLVAEAV